MQHLVKSKDTNRKWQTGSTCRKALKCLCSYWRFCSIMDCYLPPFQLENNKKRVNTNLQLHFKQHCTRETTVKQKPCSLNQWGWCWQPRENKWLRDTMQPLEIHCKELSQWLQETFTISWQKTFTETKYGHGPSQKAEQLPKDGEKMRSN